MIRKGICCELLFVYKENLDRFLLYLQTQSQKRVEKRISGIIDLESHGSEGVAGLEFGIGENDFFCG